MTRCQFKDQYPSRTRAEKVIHQRERENPTLRDTLRPYICGVCGHWHLTSQEDRNAKGDEAAA